MGSARVVIAANLLFVPFAAMMLVIMIFLPFFVHLNTMMLTIAMILAVSANLLFVPFAAMVLVMQ